MLLTFIETDLSRNYYITIINSVHATMENGFIKYIDSL